MATKLQVRRDTAANWVASNPVLSQGEPGLEIDTGYIKYGDGVTAWNDLGSQGNTLKVLSDDTRWGIHTISGVKEFTYVPRGHKWLTTIATALTEDGTYTVNKATSGYESIIDAKEAFNLNSSVYLIINGNYNGKIAVTGFTNNQNIYNLVVGSTPTINIGDQVQIMYWVKGTIAVIDDEYQWYIGQAESATSNTNYVIVNVNNLEPYTKLIANPTKSAITFDDKPVNWLQNSPFQLIDNKRSIKSVEALPDQGTYVVKITFDGRPLSVSKDTPNYVLNAIAGVGSSGQSYVAVSRTQYPELAEWVYYSGGTVTVNGQTLSLSSAPQAYNGIGNISYYGDNWVIPVSGTVTECEFGDAITITWNKPGTQIILNVFDPGQSTEQNMYQWFDWRKDLPEFVKGTRSNGVTSGKIDWSIKIARAYDNTVDNQNSFGEWTPNIYDYDYKVPLTVYFDHYNYDYARWFGRTSDSNAFYNWGPNGLFFREYPYGNRSEPIKVKIAYRMELFISEDSNWWD